MQRTLDFSRFKRPKLDLSARNPNESNESNDSHDVIKCPVCCLNLSNFQIYERDYHVDLCKGGDVSQLIVRSGRSIKKESSNGGNKMETLLQGTTIQEAIIIDDDDDPYQDIIIEDPKVVGLTRKKEQVLKIPRTKSSTKKDVRNSSLKPSKAKRIAPYFKTLTFNLKSEDAKFRVAVDGFNYSYEYPINHHFLSHFHSDHYIGMTKRWFTDNSEAKVYTSEISRKLILGKLAKNVDDMVVSITNEWETLYSLDDVEFVKVMALDAHHCPGGFIFLFKHYVLENNVETVQKVILHTGDFRVSKKMILSIDHLDFKIDEIYLDTTYLNPIYLFIEQSSLVKRTGVYLKKKFGNEDVGGSSGKGKNSILNYFSATSGQECDKSWVLLIGTYSIGKENLYLKLSEYLDTKILIPLEKFKMVRMFISVDELLKKFVIFDTNMKKFQKNNDKFYEIDEFKIYNLSHVNKSKEFNCSIHLLPIGKLSDSLFLNKYYNNKKIIKVKPTGWCFRQFSKKYSMSDNISNDELKFQFLDKILKDNEINDDEFNETLNDMLKFKNEIFLPYSEHSNFKELSLFCCYLKWDRIIPTVSNHYQKEINKENANYEFQRWFQIWKQFKIDWNYIEQYYRDEQ